MTDEEVGNLVLFGIAALVIALAHGPVSDKLAGRLTAYPTVCSDRSERCEKRRAADPIVFAAIRERQTVTMKREGTFSQLVGCVVVDRLNWECGEYRADDGAVSSLGATDQWWASPMRGGFDLSTARPAEPDEVFVSRWRWYALKYLRI